ncbi:hypothetical protein KCU59_g129, partial [Aureobasidium melanogenum]
MTIGLKERQQSSSRDEKDEWIILVDETHVQIETGQRAVYIVGWYSAISPRGGPASVAASHGSAQHNISATSDKSGDISTETCVVHSDSHGGKKLNHETPTVKLPNGSVKAEVLRIRLQPANKHRVNPIKSHGALLERDESKLLRITTVESLWVELWCVVQNLKLRIQTQLSTIKLYLQDLGHANVDWLGYS